MCISLHADVTAVVNYFLVHFLAFPFTDVHTYGMSERPVVIYLSVVF